MNESYITYRYYLSSFYAAKEGKLKKISDVIDIKIMRFSFMIF